MRKCKILVPVGCRSDEGISAPIIRRLKEAEWCEITEAKLKPSNFIKSYEKIISKKETLQYWYEKKYDLIICTGDRVEMTAAACAAYHNKIPIAHVGAGIVADTQRVTFDELNRHCITIWSDLAFCEDVDSAVRTAELWSIVGRKDDYSQPTVANIHICGITHMDDLEIDESLVPEEEYDLVLYNSTPLVKDTIEVEIERDIIEIGSNPDSVERTREIRDIVYRKETSYSYLYYDNLPRAQFIGLLKNCMRFIGNSSSMFYEAPFFLKEEQCIRVGNRNDLREFTKKETGASDKIVKILKEWWENVSE